MRRSRAFVAGCMMLGLASTARAQVLDPPPRPFGGLFGGAPPPDPNRTHQELTLQGSLFGGYDDNLIPPGGGDVVAQHPGGSTGFGDTAVRYWVGTDARSVEVGGRGYMNTYRSVGVRPGYGGEQRLRVRTTLGRRTRLEAAENLSYAPYYSLGLFSVPAGATGSQTPQNSPTNALTESGTWTKGGSASLIRQWTRQTSMDVGYAYSAQTFVKGAGFDTRTQNGSLGLDQSIGRAVTLRATYLHSDSEFTEQDGSALHLLNQTADVGLRYQRRLSRTRRLSLSGGAGGMRVDTADQVTRKPLQYWEPSAYGSVRLDTGRSWSLAGDYKRSISVLQGLAPDGFVTDTGTITVGGWVQRWLQTVFTAGYQNGVAGQRISDGTPSYDGYTGTVQLRFRLTRSWSSIVSLNTFQYHLNTEASESLGVSPRMHRDSVQVGFAWSLPLYGSAIEHREPLGLPGK
jgi:hypothetical protein